MQHSKNSQDVNSSQLLAMVDGEGLSMHQLEWVWAETWKLMKVGQPTVNEMVALVARAKNPDINAEALLREEDRILDKATGILLRLTGRLQ